jgi:hypothetical protein
MKILLTSALLIGAIVLIAELLPNQAAVEIAPVASYSRTATSITATASPAVVQTQASSAPGAQLNAAMREGIRDVAAAYEQTSSFPPYSVPLTEHHNELLAPNAGAVTERSLEASGLPGTLTVSLSAYRYQPDETIDALVNLSGDDALFAQVGRIELSVRDAHNKLIKTLTANASLERQRWQYSSRFQSEDDWPQELNLVAEVFLTNNESLRQSAPFRLFESVATISGIGDTYIDDNELVIPVTIRNAQSGFYKLGASLLYADKKPLAYLQGKARIQGSQGTVLLRAHGSILSTLNSPQPLWLSSFQLRRIPEKPGPEVSYGDSSQPVIAVPEVDPADFSAIPYQSPQVAQRLQFLQSLGQPSAADSGL